MTYLWPDGEFIAVEADSLHTPSAFIWQGRNHPVQAIA